MSNKKSNNKSSIFTISLTRAPLALAVSAALSASAWAQTDAIDKPDPNNDMEIMVVTADFRSASLEKMPSSITVIDAQQIQDENAQHFEDVMNSIANFNWSGGSSRPKYFQIRGVGEQEQYQGAPNSSVGYIVDDIDLSGIGMVSSMYDLQQVEVLRGPQGTRYGANALAGLIYLKSNDPTDVFEHGAEVSLGNDDLQTFSGFSSGPLSDSGKLLYRVALQQHQQNGYRDNLYLNKEDTNGRDEFTGRAKLRWYATDDLQLDLTLLHADFDNGYDVWSLTNDPTNTITDQPGVDSQRTTGAGFKATYSGAEQFELTSLTSFANTDHHYSYDGDWANSEYWASKQCEEGGNVSPCQYDYFWDKTGQRKTLSQEFRLSSTDQGRIFADSTDWLIGVYAMNLKEDNQLYSEYNTWPDEVLDSQYEATNYALFGQLDTDLGADYVLSVGLRVERRNSHYSDTNNDNFDPSETMWGGHIALSKVLNESHNVYARVARGYKAGGFNMTLPVELNDKKEFDTETLYNYEIGLKSHWFEGLIDTNLALFYMDRQDQQVAASQQDPNKPQRFILYTENAGSSNNYGAELDATWYATDNLQFYSSLGWLQTAYGNYQYQDKYGTDVDLTGRDLAHSPHLTYSLGGTYRANSGWFANLNMSGKSEFYYSDSNDSRSEPYTVVNARLGYEASAWSAYLWGRNLFDEEYGVRGFYFGNEPDNGWAEKQYIRYGDPRQIGVTLNVKFM
ncbi:TonB-dependent receptor [Shewanella oneidensis MR-1]|uniref:Thiamine-regulated TonB-dependent receptor n=1 Tax=Shewanella oneidensis (strain ATCC 700550 / JCM 31522 / CIP 106686 / LMG 19005 / NCIMB 14063 / MR-1) TaxID=211586 RepID=Q8EDM8_SHEON|nr:TonB-dependent receptor [Shewanella oneidensis]AAN55743.1 thiamine-regulated TonB-dependent receptor [Shewanella oneidensis MR-1]MDX5995617.1 TonB-dependent receptor [Shewanella oneidensis]MEE2026332.1 Pesticin receptor [Shewanella oneidensis]QKG97214.1 TonB-dependent receptor [Shewanella oneidensis MR-1]